MAKSWSGFVPQNLSIKKEWKLLELSQALGPDLLIVSAEPEEEQSISEEPENSTLGSKLFQLKPRKLRD